MAEKIEFQMKEFLT